MAKPEMDSKAMAAEAKLMARKGKKSKKPNLFLKAVKG